MVGAREIATDSINDGLRTGRGRESSPWRAAGLSAMILCCAAMIVGVREPVQGPAAFFAASVIVDGVRGTGSMLAAAGMTAVLLWPLWAYLGARRAWDAPVLAMQVLFHLGVLGYFLLRTDPGHRDAILLSSLPLAMAVTFSVYDVLTSLDKGSRDDGPGRNDDSA